MDREKAFEILKEHVSEQSLLRHSFAVESSMIAYAKYYEEDSQKWGNIGLLHDIDFEKYPEFHPNKAKELLLPYDVDSYMIECIEAHIGFDKDGNDLRDDTAKKVLCAVDQMSSFIVAVALMRPTKLEGLALKSVKKKLKDKAFAKAVDREMLYETMETLGVDLATHVKIIVDGLIIHEEFLNKEGCSLF